MKITILDSTLRDGAQSGGISFSVEDKIKIASCLADFGITYIEGGNPYSNPKDMEFFERAGEINLKDSKLLAFGSTVKKDTDPNNDDGIKSLLSANTNYVSIVGKSSALHVTEVLGVSLSDNLKMINDTVSFLVNKNKTVFFDAEHFFDGYKENKEYAAEVLSCAEKAGASAVVLCDTNGGSFPDEISEAVRYVKNKVNIEVGIHCHNDVGCAVASSVLAVFEGIGQVQGTFLGIGERCGNADLATIIANLQLKKNYEIVKQESMKNLTSVSRYISEISNTKLPSNTPYIGSLAFAHKGGMHADGVSKISSSFEHISPETVGNERFLILSEVSGRSAVLARINEVLEKVKLDKNSKEIKSILEKIKNLEQNGFLFEAANASFELLVLKELGMFSSFFEIVDYNVVISKQSDKNPLANAMVKVAVGELFEITADEGEGPVNAIDKALRKALEVFYPELRKMRLIDYKVRVINTGKSTASITRVLIESTDGVSTWTTVGASSDIINASITALTDSLQYMLNKKN